VLQVTNLNDRGPGSLRAALEADGPRIVVFRVAGIITLHEEIQIKHPYLTIAGHTAPGGGILLRGTDNTLLRILGAHDIIIRYLRLRNGSGVADGHGHDNLTITGGHNIIVDHVSMSWSTDENASLHRKSHQAPIYNVTLQRLLLAEGLAGHSNGLLISGSANYRDPTNPLEAWRDVSDLSIHHNLFVHNTHRNPRVTAVGAQVINNVMYNWGDRIGSTTRGAVVDWINNYAQAGPMSSLAHVLLHQAFIPFRPQEIYPEPSLYLSGNVVHPRHPDPSADNWVLYRVHYAYTPLPASYRRATPWLPAPLPVTVQLAVHAYESVLADVGANARLDCDGTWVPNADTVDVRLLADVRDQTGPAAPIPHPAQVGGYPVLAPGTPCADRDQDGMPDVWEQPHGFDPTDPTDGPADGDGDGYTNVEEYLHGKSGSG
jgi:hypothetical protein